MTTTMDREEFLQHYGVKGMKWGRRKAESSSGGKKPRTPEQVARNKKIAKTATTLALAAGAAYASAYLNKSGNKPAQLGKRDKQIESTGKVGSDYVNRINKSGYLKLGVINRYSSDPLEPIRRETGIRNTGEAIDYLRRWDEATSGMPKSRK